MSALCFELEKTIVIYKVYHGGDCGEDANGGMIDKNGTLSTLTAFNTCIFSFQHREVVFERMQEFTELTCKLAYCFPPVQRFPVFHTHGSQRYICFTISLASINNWRK